MSQEPSHPLCTKRRQDKAAAKLYAKALNALESEAAQLGGEDVDRSGFRASHARYYREYVDLLLSQNSVERAFEVLERSRAQTLIETLARGGVQVTNGVDRQLLDQEHSLEHALSARTGYRIELLTGRHSEKQVAEADRDINALLEQYRHVEEQIRAASPNYYALRRPTVLSVSDVQQRLLDERTVLLEYTLGDERSYVFAVDSHSAVAYPLAGRAEIESAARRVYALLTARHEAQGHGAAKLADEQREYAVAATALSRMVLGPVADRIRGKRLLIVGDGALLYIPFAALPVPKGLLRNAENVASVGCGTRDRGLAIRIGARDSAAAGRSEKAAAEGSSCARRSRLRQDRRTDQGHRRGQNRDRAQFATATNGGPPVTIRDGCRRVRTAHVPAPDVHKA